jgi:phosphoribosylformimino-5-aminoimidazole carboxamide ribotide isomerase
MFTVYPAIDLRNGQVVRLRQGDPAQQTVYSDNPVAVAKHWVSEGATWLHVVNLDGAFGDQTAARANRRASHRLGAQASRPHAAGSSHHLGARASRPRAAGSSHHLGARASRPRAAM